MSVNAVAREALLNIIGRGGNFGDDQIAECFAPQSGSGAPAVAARFLGDSYMDEDTTEYYRAIAYASADPADDWVKIIPDTEIDSRFSARPFGKIVAIGDSQFANAIGTASPDSTYFHQRGDINWFQCLTGQPLSHEAYYPGSLPPQGHNVGVGSQETKDMIARFKVDVLDKKPNIVFIRAGTNDITGSLAAGTIINNLRWMIRRSLSCGARVWISTIWPRNNSTGSDFSSAQETVRQTVNTAIRLFGLIPGVVVADDDAELADANGDMPTSASYDGVHVNSTGAYRLAKNVLLPLWQRASGVERVPSYKPEDYNATTVPYGNLLTNSAMTGTTGTISTGCSAKLVDGVGVGTLPTSWRCERSVGSTLTAYVSTVSEADWNGDTANFIQLDISSAGSGVDPETMRTRHSATSITANVAAGWYKAQCLVKIPAGGTAAFLRSAYLQAVDLEGTDSFFRCFSVAYTNSSVKDIWPSPEGGLVLLLETPKMLVDGTTGLTFYMLADCDATMAGSVTVKWGTPFLVPIPGSLFERDIALDQPGIPTEALTVAGALELGKTYHSVANAAGAPYAVTLAAPTASNRGQIKEIEMTVATSAVTLALTNVEGGSAATTATFDAIGEKLILIAGASKWCVLKEQGVTLS